jgi:GNAT superfamily N-acetyltransferase
VHLRELLEGETHLAFEAARELRPSLESAEAFVTRVDTIQRPEGYRLVGAFLEGSDTAVAFTGFRVLHNLAWGHVLYIDDLGTLPAARGQGAGRALLDWCLDEARRLGCDQLHLDSGFGPDRADAHRLYLNAGYRLSSHHFAREA